MPTQMTDEAKAQQLEDEAAQTVEDITPRSAYFQSEMRHAEMKLKIAEMLRIRWTKRYDS